MAFRLQTLLDLKTKAEDDAEKAVAAAATARAKAEWQQAELETAVLGAREKLKQHLDLPVETLADGQEVMSRERFRKRLRADVERRVAQAQAHSGGPLAAARAAEVEARGEHLRCRQEREALDKLKEQDLAKDKAIAERRADEALGDLAMAAIARKSR